MFLRTLAFVGLAYLAGACGGGRPHEGKTVLCLQPVDTGHLSAHAFGGALKAAAGKAGDTFAGYVGKYGDQVRLVFFAEGAADPRGMRDFHERMKAGGAAAVGFVQLVFGRVSEESAVGNVRIRQELAYRVVDVHGKVMTSGIARAKGERSVRTAGAARNAAVASVLAEGVDRIVDEAAHKICDFCNSAGEKKE